MKLTADSNVLLRVAVGDDAAQAAAATRLLASADTIVIPLPALCEFAWVLRRGYRLDRDGIRQSIAAAADMDKAVVDQAAVATGLAFLDAGADFADGVIAHLGRAAGGDVFATFDGAARAAATRLGIATVSPLDA